MDISNNNPQIVTLSCEHLKIITGGGAGWNWVGQVIGHVKNLFSYFGERHIEEQQAIVPYNGY
jgi:hypothetical protein